MLVFKSFFRKKNTLSYLLINFLVFTLIAVLLIFNEYFLCKFDLEYKNAKINVTSKEKLNLKSNIYYVSDESNNNGMYYYEIKLYHWFDYNKKLEILNKDLENKYEDMILDFSTSNNDKITQIITIYHYAMIIIIIGYIIFIIIAAFNLISDSKTHISLLKYLGFRNLRIHMYTLLETLSLFLIPFSIIYIIYKIIMLIMF